MLRKLTFQEFRLLDNNTTVHCINNGNIDSFIIIGTISTTTGVAVVSTMSYKDMKFIYSHDFDQTPFNDPFWTLDYDTREVGQLMIDQVNRFCNKEIENIKAVYLK